MHQYPTLGLAKKEDNRCHNADRNHHGPNDTWVELASKSSARIASHNRARQHHQGIRPPHFSGDDKADDCCGVGQPPKKNLVGVHRLQIRKAEKIPHGKGDQAERAAEVSGIDAEKKVNDKKRKRPDLQQLVLPLRDSRAEDKYQSCRKQLPRHDDIESLLRC